MAKLTLNPLLAHLSGTIDRLTVRQTPHGAVITPKAETPRKWSSEQRANRQRMSEASRFYRAQMCDPARAAHLRARAKEMGLPVSAFVIGGFIKHGDRFATWEAPPATPRGEFDGRDGGDVESAGE
jgi:hypothetical protein